MCVIGEVTWFFVLLKGRCLFCRHFVLWLHLVIAVLNNMYAAQELYSHILEKNGTASICWCIEGLKLRSMLCLFIGGECVCVCGQIWYIISNWKSGVVFCGFPCHLMLTQVRTLLDIVKKASSKWFIKCIQLIMIIQNVLLNTSGVLLQGCLLKVWH